MYFQSHIVSYTDILMTDIVVKKTISCYYFYSQYQMEIHHYQYQKLSQRIWP